MTPAAAGLWSLRRFPPSIRLRLLRTAMPLVMRSYLREQVDKFAAGMRLVFEESMVQKAAPQAARRWLDRFATMAYYLSLSGEQRDRSVMFTGMPELESIRSEGRPVIVSMFHFGRYDVVGPSLAKLNFRVSMMVQKEALEWAQHDVAALGLQGDFDLLSDPNLEFITFPSLTSIPRAAKALAAGRVLLALPDFIEVGEGRRSLPFLGLEVYPSYAVEVLSRRTGAAVLVADTRAPMARSSRGEPLQIIPLEKIDAGERGEEGWLTAQLLARAERQIRADPISWNLWPLLALAANKGEPAVSAAI